MKLSTRDRAECAVHPLARPGPLPAADGELFDRAVRVHHRRAKAGGYNYDQPSATLSDVLRDGTVILRNINGVLARVKPLRKAVLS
jgi:hypothetical protein